MKSSTLELAYPTYPTATATSGCNDCRWCELNRLYGPKNAKILDAYCKFQTSKTDPHQELKNRNPHIFRVGAYLSHNENQVFTPTWCPVKTNGE